MILATRIFASQPGFLLTSQDFCFPARIFAFQRESRQYLRQDPGCQELRSWWDCDRTLPRSQSLFCKGLDWSLPAATVTIQYITLRYPSVVWKFEIWSQDPVYSRFDFRWDNQILAFSSIINIISIYLVSQGDSSIFFLLQLLPCPVFVVRLFTISVL